MTRDPTEIPERWLDILTGYIGVALIFCASLFGLALLFH
jgi:hypothetical protein